jgi:hypothetical protein
MATVVVQAGACGYSVTVNAEPGAGGTVTVTLETDCEMVMKMKEDLRSLDKRAALTGFADNPVYRAAAKHLKHVACPVPTGILKAIEVAAGLNVSRDVRITFVVRS